MTTATTKMTDVVVVPSLGGLLVGCVLLLVVGEGVGVGAVDRKHTLYHFT